MINKKPWFTIALLLTAILMMIPLFDYTQKDDQWLVFLSCLGVILCAVAPNFKEELEGKIHFTGAGMAGIFSQLWCCLYNNWTLWIWVFMGVMLGITWLTDQYNQRESKIAFWAELLCFVNIYFTYFYYL
jgi:hypothetical protein